MPQAAGCTVLGRQEAAPLPVRNNEDALCSRLEHHNALALPAASNELSFVLQAVQEVDESVHTSSNESLPLALGGTASDGMEAQQGIMQQVHCKLQPSERVQS